MTSQDRPARDPASPDRTAVERNDSIEDRIAAMNAALSAKLAAIDVRLDALVDGAAPEGKGRQARLDQLRRRASALLAAARRARATVAADRERLVEALRAVQDAKVRLAAEQERSRRLAATLAAGVAGPRTGGRDPAATVFAWPQALAGDDRTIEGAVDRVDRHGIAGWVRFAAHPDRIPIVEALLDDAFVLARACSPEDDRHRFVLAWRDFPADAAGRRVVIRVAGIDRAIDGPTLIVPPTQRHLHQTAEGLATELFGETIEDAKAYRRWIEAHGEEAGIAAAQAFLAGDDRAWPLISVVVFGSVDSTIGSTVDALCAQVYPHWELVGRDMPSELEARDPRIRALSAGRLGERLTGDLVAFVEAGDAIAPTALLHLAIAADAAPDFTLLYSDEDVFDPASGVRGLPYLKGGWSDDLALAQDYASRLALVPRRLLDDGPDPLDAAAVHGIVVGAAVGARARVIHLPFVLYHRSAENRRTSESIDFGRCAHDLALRFPDRFGGATVTRAATGRWAVRRAVPDPAPRVSLVVPTRDRLDLLQVCIAGVLERTDYPDIELLIADNDSVEPGTLAYFADIARDPRVRVIRCPGPFNYSAINNRAVAAASGSIVGLLNNDLAMSEPGWLRSMVGHVVRPDIGVVGAKLLYGDETVQHAGIVLGIGTASHLYRGAPATAPGRGLRLQLTQDVSAVTGACLLARRAVWDEVGGLDEGFPVAYNDVDFCLRVLAADYRIVWNADAVVHHLESQTRGADVAEKRARLIEDQARMAERWGDRIADDSFYSPNLSLKSRDAQLAFPPRVARPWQVVPSQS